MAQQWCLFKDMLFPLNFPQVAFGDELAACRGQCLGLHTLLLLGSLVMTSWMLGDQHALLVNLQVSNCGFSRGFLQITATTQQLLNLGQLNPTKPNQARSLNILEPYIATVDIPRTLRKTAAPMRPWFSSRVMQYCRPHSTFLSQILLQLGCELNGCSIHPSVHGTRRILKY